MEGLTATILLRILSMSLRQVEGLLYAMKPAAGPQISLSLRCLLGLLAVSSLLETSKALPGAASTTAPYLHVTSNATEKLQYVIYPADRYNVEQTNATERFLQKIIGKNQTNVVVNPLRGVELWGLELDSSQLKKVAGHIGIGLVYKNEDIASPDVPSEDVASNITHRNLHRDLFSTPITKQPTNGILTGRESRITNQANAPDDLKVLAQPSPLPLSKVKSYVYNDNAGEGIYIYVLDRGFNPENSDFTNMVHPPQKRDWLFVPSLNPYDTGWPDYTDSREPGHGSCIASKAAGAKSGVAKKARLVPVVREDDSSYAILTSMVMTLDDVVKHKRQGKAVVVFALGKVFPVFFLFCFSCIQRQFLTA